MTRARGKVVQQVEAGILHRNDQFPHLYWQNFLAVDCTRQLSAQSLIAEAERHFADLPIRHVLVTDAQAAAHLRTGFLEGGYQEVVIVTMLLRRPPDREPPAADLVELDAAQLGPTVEAYMRDSPRARDEDAQRELSQLKEDLGRSGVRFLAARVDGEVAGWCELRRHGAGGQVEDVVVLEPFRGRGLARALLCGAVKRLRADGCEPIFVVADDNDTVKDLYRRLGFDDDRRRWSFWWPGL
ncbi:MAG: GNAT family N-acetyltransferase [Solirubrobacterales bacterium]|nr:GNAT family N-acetyltransferase [Solirubrobacterales bacterium]